jgi:hypothetical protein
MGDRHRVKGVRSRPKLAAVCCLFDSYEASLLAAIMVPAFNSNLQRRSRHDLLGSSPEFRGLQSNTFAGRRH